VESAGGEDKRHDELVACARPVGRRTRSDLNPRLWGPAPIFFVVDNLGEDDPAMVPNLNVTVREHDRLGAAVAA
jgi:hypothetical protein